MHACTYACLYVCLYECIYVCLYVCMLICMSVCLYACLYVYMHVYMFIRMYLCLYSCMYVYMHECIFVLLRMYLDICNAMISIQIKLIIHLLFNKIKYTSTYCFLFIFPINIQFFSTYIETVPNDTKILQPAQPIRHRIQIHKQTAKHLKRTNHNLLYIVQKLTSLLATLLKTTVLARKHLKTCFFLISST